MKCNGCFREVQSDFNVCPYCAKQLEVQAEPMMQNDTQSQTQSSATETPFQPVDIRDSKRNWMGIVSLVLGGLSIVSCFTAVTGFLFGIPAVVFGILGRKSQKSDFAIIGLILGIIGILFGVFVAIVFSLTYAAFETMVSFAVDPFLYDSFGGFDSFYFDNFATMFRS